MQPTQQFSARRLDPVLMLDLCADNTERPGSSNVVARISELDPRVLLSLGFAVEVNGMITEEGAITASWADDMLHGSAYPLINTGFSSKYGTAIPNLDHEIVRPVIGNDGVTVEVFGTALKPAVDTIDLVLKYIYNGDTFTLNDRVRVYAIAEVGMENNAEEGDVKAVLDRVHLRVHGPAIVGGLWTSE